MKLGLLFVVLGLTATTCLTLASCTDEGGTAEEGGNTTGGTTSGTTTSGTTSGTTTSGTTGSSTGGEGGATTGDGGGDAATTVNVALVYAGRFNNIDQRLATATLGEGGRILGYVAGASEAPYVTTAQVDGIYSDTFSGASRWTNGDIVGPFYSDGGPRNIPAGDGQHLGIAKVPGDLPASGTATYALASATKPTYANGEMAEGTVTAASATATFAGNSGTRLAVTVNITMPDGAFELRVNGGSGAFDDDAGTAGTFGGDAGFRFTGGTVTLQTPATACGPDGGAACPTTGGVRAVFAGTNAERVLLAYVFDGRRGVIVLQKQ